MKHSDSKNLWADILLWILPVLLVIPNIALCFTEHTYSGLDCAVNIVLPLGVYGLLCAVRSNIGRTALLFFPVMILCAFQLVLLYLYGNSIIAVDMFLNVATTNFSEASELLVNLWPAVVAVCVLYLPPVIAGIILCVAGARSGKVPRHIILVGGIVFSALGFVMLLIAFFTPDGYKPQRKLFPVNVIANMAYAVDRTVQTKHYDSNSAAFSFGAVCERDADTPEIYVMVVGETSRAGNWQLGGYRRSTNPHLSQRPGLVFFSKALSESNTTHKSVPLMLSHLSADEFRDSIYCSKGIVAAFSEAGYSSAWISSQKRNHSLIDFFGSQADTTEFITDDGHSHLDEELCDRLKAFLEAPGARKRFVVIHTYGSHFSYRDRYPSAYTDFTPDRYSGASASCRSELVNAYDNTIAYTDAVLDSIISVIESYGVPSALVYAADHGEDIFDDSRERFLHASPVPTARQLHVPMFVWMSGSYRREHPDKYAGAIANSGKEVSTSRSVFHTLLSLAGIRTPVSDESAALDGVAYREQSRVYLNDRDEAVSLPDCGMEKEDVDYFLHARIRP